MLELLGRMRYAGATPDIYVVTRFVMVSDQLRRLVYESGLLTDWVENPRTWPNERIGTVHTVQGREAEAVIVAQILGFLSYRYSNRLSHSKSSTDIMKTFRAKSGCRVLIR
ncbi:hypothetical protein GCM10023091_16220 [Ravibacter arvi]|uniref:Uncharacterized protein n=1 Tax=Ravibacter arvi TaxID=2051041 RepID=A0ABP8LXC3_9BACT